MSARIRARRLTIVASISLAALLLQMGCTNFAPHDISNLIGNDAKPDSSSGRLDSDDFYLAPEAHQAIQDSTGSINESNLNVERAKPILEPLTEEQFVIATNAGRAQGMDANDRMEAGEETISKPIDMIQELVPDPELVSLPVNPVGLGVADRRDAGSGEPIAGQEKPVPQRETVTLRADPSYLESDPQFSERGLHPIDDWDDVAQTLPQEPCCLPPCEIVDPRFPPNDQVSVDFPNLPVARRNDFETKKVAEYSVGYEVEYPLANIESTSAELPLGQELGGESFAESRFTDSPESATRASLLSSQWEFSETIDALPETHDKLLDLPSPLDDEPGVVVDAAPMLSGNQQSNQRPTDGDSAASIDEKANNTRIEAQVADLHEREVEQRFRMVNATFCTSVSGYGQFIKFENTQFKSGQRLLVYCEIENFTSVESVAEGQATFSTRLRGSYLVYDSKRNVVDRKEFPVVEDVSVTRRHDFYVHLPIRLGVLGTGDYQLQIVIEDLGGSKTATLEAPLGFSIREASGE